MAKAAFKAVVFDLFDTIVKWEPDRLPLMELNGHQIHTTMPWGFPLLEQRFGAAFDRDRFIEVYHGVIDEIIAEREVEHLEITCTERFVRDAQAACAGARRRDRCVCRTAHARAHGRGARGDVGAGGTSRGGAQHIGALPDGAAVEFRRRAMRPRSIRRHRSRSICSRR